MKYKPYCKAFRLGIAQEFVYRANFFMGRARSVLVLFLMYYVWLAVFKETPLFSGYSVEMLTNYIFIAHILRSFVIGTQVRNMAYEISDGSLSRYLVQPIHHGLFHFMRELAARVVQFLSAIVEVGVLSCVIPISLPSLLSSTSLLVWCIVVPLSFFLYFLMSYTANLFAFWSREAMGPLFFFDWFMEFASGSFFPLNIISTFFTSVILTLPFAYTIFVPATLFLENSGEGLIRTIGIMVIWCGVFLLAAKIIFTQGLKEYSGEGL